MAQLAEKSKLIPKNPTIPPGEADSEVMLVTPAQATKWLEENMRTNRPCSDRIVKGYSADMAAGRWMLNGESVKFDIEENLVDGQHRLWACVNAQVPFWTVVTRNLPKHAFATIDTGKKRSASDAMHIAGMGAHYKTTIAAVIRMVVAYRGQLPVGHVAVPNAQILAFVHDEPGIAGFVAKVRSALGKPLKGMASPVAAVLFLASHGTSTDDFLEKLGSGEGLTKSSPILTLRNKLLGMGSNNDATERFWSVVVAWNAYVDGRSLQAIRVPQELPKIKGAK